MARLDPHTQTGIPLRQGLDPHHQSKGFMKGSSPKETGPWGLDWDLMGLAPLWAQQSYRTPYSQPKFSIAGKVCSKARKN